jgi:hypothetical protein
MYGCPLGRPVWNSVAGHIRDHKIFVLKVRKLLRAKRSSAA